CLCLGVLFAAACNHQAPNQTQQKPQHATSPQGFNMKTPEMTARLEKPFTLDDAFAGDAALLGRKGKLYAKIETSMGDMTVRLFEEETPMTVANFVGLSRGSREWFDAKSGQIVKRPLYQNVICHRVIPEFMIQCGDPEGNGRGGPGYQFADEF